MVEIPLLTVVYGIILAVLFPTLYRNFPVGIIGLWLLGLGLARFYCQNVIGHRLRRLLGVPVYLWAYLLLSTVPLLCLWQGFPEGALLMIVQPFLAYRLQLRVTSSDEGE